MTGEKRVPPCRMLYTVVHTSYTWVFGGVQDNAASLENVRLFIISCVCNKIALTGRWTWFKSTGYIEAEFGMDL